MKHETPIDLWLYEKEAFADGFQLVCGVDEAGRGPLAGPVCAAAVILPSRYAALKSAPAYIRRNCSRRSRRGA